ncbi:MAG: HAD hydrolase-like protein [Bdellovibrionales bacterium]|nr:HAD hydrolase-like protein [Bdellovibrionales bacterium]
MHSLKAIIFDLDDTLLDTSGLLVPHAIHESCSELIHRGLKIKLNQCIEEKRDFAKSNSRINFFEYLVEKYADESLDPQTKKQLIRLGKDKFYNRKIKEPLNMVDGAKDFLSYAIQKNLKLFLVTEGAFATQKEKVEQLNIGSFFEEIFYANPENGENKESLFKKILNLYNLSGSEVLCVGNRVDNEISAGNHMQMITCLINTGEYNGLIPKSASEIPTYTFKEFKDLKEWFLR